MSARKEKLGRNPFDKSAASAKKAQPSAAKPKSTAGDRKKRSRAKQQNGHTRPEGLAGLLEDLNYRIIPRLKACTYLRALKALARIVR